MGSCALRSELSRHSNLATAFQATDGDLATNDVMKQQLDAHKALATLQSEGDALVWLLNGLHTLSREKRSKTLAMRSRRAAVVL